MCAILRYRSIPAAILLLFVASCGEPAAPRTCAVAADCGSGSWCRAGYCVANALPLAVIEPPSSVTSNRPLTFRGSGSRDPDEEDAVASWHWSVQGVAGSASAACAPLPPSGSGSDLTVIFPCAGEYDVALEVVDSQGATSPRASVRTAVALSTDPPSVVAGADLSVDHRCSGSPLTCTPWDGQASELALEAAASGPPATTFAYRWTVEPPPELSGLPAPRVSFSPSAEVASPRASIETAGTAIAGRYLFTISVTDSRGMVAVARQRVEVGNRPPVLSGGVALEVPHGYEASTRRFVASGSTPPATWSDPDGDPVVSLGFTPVRGGDGGNLFAVEDRGDHASFTVLVAHTGPSDAAFLTGPGVHRRIELTVADANGARASTSWAVAVGNRPPRVAAAVSSAAVDHLFDAGTRRYIAEAPLSTFVDDDGDPVELSASGDPACGEVSARQGTAWVTCSLAWTGGTAGLASFAGSHALLLSSRDPFGPGASQASTIAIGNRPPRVLAAQVDLPVTCRPTTTCCELGTSYPKCAYYDHIWPSAGAARVMVVDDDGDPLDVGAASSLGCLETTLPASQPCPAGGCTVGVAMCGGRSACGTFVPEGSIALSASDGVASSRGEAWVYSVCQP
jgi:hypothetical protein